MAIITISRDTANTWLSDTPEDKVFFCGDGRVVKNLEELATALQLMPVEVFDHHVNKSNNDFSNWIKDVIGDNTLANQLKKSTTQNQATRRIETRLQFLKSKL